MRGPFEPKHGRHFRAHLIGAAFTLFLAGCAATVDDSKLDVTAPPAALPPNTLAFAEKAIEDGRYADAKLLVERVLLVDGENPRAKLVLAEIRLATGATESASALFGELEENPETRARALQGLGLTHFANGDMDSGAEKLRQSVEEDASLWRAWNGLGYYYDTQENRELAIEQYTTALEVQGDNPIVLNNRGFSRLMLGQLDGAIEDLTDAIRQDPGMSRARTNLRLAFAWQGKYVLAIAGVPKDKVARALNNAGYVAMLRGDFAEAESYLLRAVEADPSFSPIARRNLELLAYLREVAEAETDTSL